MVAFHLGRNVSTIFQLQRHISITSDFIIGGAVLRDGYSWIDIQSLRSRLVDKLSKNEESTGWTNLEMILNPGIVKVFHTVDHRASSKSQQAMCGCVHVLRQPSWGQRYGQSKARILAYPFRRKMQVTFFNPHTWARRCNLQSMSVPDAVQTCKFMSGQT